MNDHRVPGGGNKNPGAFLQHRDRGRREGPNLAQWSPSTGHAQPYPSAASAPPFPLCLAPWHRMDPAWPPCSQQAFSHFSSKMGSDINSPGWWASGLWGPLALSGVCHFPGDGWRWRVGFETGIHVSEERPGQMGMSGGRDQRARCLSCWALGRAHVG